MRILSDREYQRMERNGWRMVTIHAIHNDVRDSQTKRLQSYYGNIKRYYMTTRVRGYYHEVWACKVK